MSSRCYVRPGLGSIRECRPGQRRIVVQFDDETFDQIHSRATKHHQSFAASVRDLVEIGLEEEALQ